MVRAGSFYHGIPGPANLESVARDVDGGDAMALRRLGASRNRGRAEANRNKAFWCWYSCESELAVHAWNPFDWVRFQLDGDGGW